LSAPLPVRGDLPLMSREQAEEHEARIAGQMKLAVPFAEMKPSTVSEVYWIYSTRREVGYPKPTERSGKWIVTGDAARIDEVWAKVKVDTEEGRLGDGPRSRPPSQTPRLPTPP